MNDKNGRAKGVVWRIAVRVWGLALFGLRCHAQMILDESCTVTVGNQTAVVRPDGTFFLQNVSIFQSRDTGIAPQLYRVRATCVRDGKQVTGQSEFFELKAGQTTFVADVFPTDLDPIPVSISVTGTGDFVPLGSTVQLKVIATFADGSTEDVTARAKGTTFLSTNPNLLSVDKNGLVTGQNRTLGPQNGMIAVLNEGNIATIALTAVGQSNDFDNDGLPNDYEDLYGLNKFVNDANADKDGDGLTNLREFQIGTIPNNPDTDGDGIPDGQDGDPLHPEESPPTVVILLPPDGATVVEGQSIEFTVNATDDGRLTEVVLKTDTGFTRTFAQPPFKATVVIPIGIAQITFTATATDSVENVTTKSSVLSVIPDPKSTIVGMVVTKDGVPVEGAVVTVIGVGASATTDANGHFEIPNVPTVQGDFRLRASATGIVAVTDRHTFVLGGITDVGTIVLKEDRQSSGLEFVVAFQANDGFTGSPTLRLFLSGEDRATGQVEVPGIGFTQTFSVEPGVVTSVVIPTGAIVNSADGIENKGIRVSADAPVTVYGLNQARATTDAFAALPVATLGTRYRALSYTGGINGASQLAVVTSEDNTTLTIIPQQTLGGRPAGVPFTITLNALQVYQIRGNDVSGTTVVGSKPIAVFSGNVCVTIPPGFSACDHIVEQMPPVDTWGESVLTVPLATRLRGDTFRILADESDTTVNIIGPATESFVLTSGQFAERVLVGNNRITSDKRILVAQYSNGTSFDGVTSDPFMMLVVPAEQFLRNYTFSTPSSGFRINFVNIVADTTDAQSGGILLDGIPLPASDFVPIPATTFSAASKSIKLGSHTISSVTPSGIFVYGFDAFDSYGYPGGFGLEAR